MDRWFSFHRSASLPCIGLGMLSGYSTRLLDEQINCEEMS
jgi:hypothetical protein